VQWAILRGETETGVSVIHMTPGLDAGPILAQRRTSIDPDEDAAQLESRLATMGAGLVLQVVDCLESGLAEPIQQETSQISKAPRLKKEQGLIDWSRPAREIQNQVRGLVPWPRAYTFWHSAGAEPVRINIDRVTIPDSTWEIASATRHSGVVLEATSRLVVAAGDGAVEIVQLQPAGKRSMSAAEFLRGNRITPGEHLGPADDRRS
jgi:methionyl-tRNA formyltransferase